MSNGQEQEGLIKRAAEGDRAAQDDLLRRHFPSLQAFIRLQAPQALRQKESVSDLVQSVFREALDNVDKFEWRGDGSFRNWLYAYARNKLGNKIQYYQAEKRSPDRELPLALFGSGDLSGVYASICSPSEQAIGKEFEEALERAFEELPEDYRDIIIQARLLGLPHSEIAKNLGKSETATRSLLKRALLRLSVMLEKHSGS